MNDDGNHEYEQLDSPVEISLGDQNPRIVGGFSIRSAVMPVERDGETRHYPMLIFDFSIRQGVQLQPIALVMDETDLDGVGRLIGNAGHGAIESARKADGRDPRTGRRAS